MGELIITSCKFPGPDNSYVGSLLEKNRTLVEKQYLPKITN